MHVAPGRYRVTAPPDLNAAAETERRFLLEYAYPVLVVLDLATSRSWEKDKGVATQWESSHPEIGVHIGYDRSGYLLGDRNRQQIIPNKSVLCGPAHVVQSVDRSQGHISLSSVRTDSRDRTALDSCGRASLRVRVIQSLYDVMQY